MGKLKRYYNQNRKMIWKIIIIIIFAFAILRLSNHFAKINNQKEAQNINSLHKSSTTNNYGNNNVSVSNENSKKDLQTKQKNTINQFVEYCNKKDLENAYNMITDDCKNEMFNDLQTFESIYYNTAFENREKKAIIKNWSYNTYLVYFREDSLSSGKINDMRQKGDYITVVKEDNEKFKLNINSYIGNKKIEKTKEEKGLKIEILSKNIYMDYEEYLLKISNNTSEDVTLDTLENSQSIYLEDSKKMKYSAYEHELSKSDLTIGKGHVRQLKVKFYNSYSLDKTIKAMVFSNLLIKEEKNKFSIGL